MATSAEQGRREFISQYEMDRGRHAIFNPLTLYTRTMSRAIGFAIALVTIAVFLPDVFHSVEALLLKSLVLANASLDSLASVGHLVR